MAWTIEQLGKKGDSYFAHPQVGEGVSVMVLGEVAADVVSVANQIEARVCVPFCQLAAERLNKITMTDAQSADLKARFSAFKANQKVEVA